jgi:hypothetical protein
VTRKFEIGDHVTWNSEAGHVSGRIIKVHTHDTEIKGYTHHATPADHVAIHKGGALRKTHA